MRPGYPLRHYLTGFLIVGSVVLIGKWAGVW